MGIPLHGLHQRPVAAFHRGFHRFADRGKCPLEHCSVADRQWRDAGRNGTERVVLRLTQNVEGWRCGFSNCCACSGDLLLMDCGCILRVHGQRGDGGLGWLMVNSTFPFRCTKCQIEFPPLHGGACYVCDRVFCGMHLHPIRIDGREVVVCDEDYVWSDRLHERLTSSSRDEGP
jgi:hypothetical protein